MTMARYRRPVQDAAGNLVPNIWCEVRAERAGLPRAQIFSDREGTQPLTNPAFFASGVVQFHAAGGAYRVRIYGNGTDQVFRYEAIGTAQEFDVDQLGIGTETNVQVPTPDDLSEYDEEPEGFSALVSDIGDGRAGIYTRMTATPGVWSGPAVVTGRDGPPGQGLSFNVVVADLAERAEYDDEPEGFRVLVQDSGNGRPAVFIKGPGGSGDWIGPAYVTGDRFDIAAFVSERPHSGETVLRHVFSDHPISFLAGLETSAANAEDPAADEAVFHIFKNFSEVGTITFAQNEYVGTFNFPSNIVFEKDDVLSVVAPAPQDATLFNISITLAGARFAA